MKINTILDQIDMGSMALPEFQRGYVWNRSQVRDLMDSLYKRHPVGSLLVWETSKDKADTRGQDQVTDTVKLLLDGQQRVTSLYGIIKGKPPEFFDGNPKAFTNLYFHIEDEAFEFYGPMKMDGNPYWIDVTKLMQEGIGDFMNTIYNDEELRENAQSYLNRLNQIHQIKDIDLHIEEVTGQDKDTETVVEIFNMVNSGGTKLSKGDLALAKICASWPEARDELKNRIEKWKEYGFDFKMDWYLRCINAILTGEAKFNALDDASISNIKKTLEEAEEVIDKLINIISSRLGLDHDRVLGSVYSFPVMCRYLAENGKQFSNHLERDKMLYWYVHTFLWGRYAGSTESVLNKDLEQIEDHENGIDNLIEELRKDRGDLKLYASDFKGWSRGARFYPMLYMLTRVWHSKDWESGIELSQLLLGSKSSLQLHHIFPKSFLYDQGYEKREVNALANMTFLTQETNQRISDTPPSEYMPEVVKQQPGALDSHWIPKDPELWKAENYLEFLNQRRELLANASNEFLNSLVKGEVKERPKEEKQLTQKPGQKVQSIESITSLEEEQMLVDLQKWMRDQGLPNGDWGYEVMDEENNEPIAFLDLAWPNGIQEHLSEPVALLIDEDKKTEEAANQAGFRFFTNVDKFKVYVLEEILAENGK